MNTYRNKLTGAVVTVSSEIGGDWVLVSQSPANEEPKQKKPVKEDKPKKAPKKKK